MGWDTELRKSAESQHGVAAVCEARMLGATGKAIARQVERGHWERVTRRVLRLVGAPRTDHQAAMAAVLDVGPGSCLAYRSAAWLWGLPGFRSEALWHVAVVKGAVSRRRSGVVVHQLRAAPQAQVTVLDGIPVVRPGLLILQLCGSEHPARAERALDNAWSMRLLSGPSLRAALGELAASGRNGVTLLRQLLDERGPGYVPPASALEARFAELVREAGLPPMRRQVDLGGDDWTGRVDFLQDTSKLVVEIDSERYHVALSDQRNDGRRRRALEAAGFRVWSVCDSDIWNRRAYVIAQLRRLRRAAAA